MIKITNKSVFNSGCGLIVNTINCHGVMGAGIALEFSLRYPQMFNQYKHISLITAISYHSACKISALLP